MLAIHSSDNIVLGRCLSVAEANLKEGNTWGARKWVALAALTAPIEGAAHMTLGIGKLLGAIVLTIVDIARAGMGKSEMCEIYPSLEHVNMSEAVKHLGKGFGLCLFSAQQLKGLWFIEYAVFFWRHWAKAKHGDLALLAALAGVGTMHLGLIQLAPTLIGVANPSYAIKAGRQLGLLKTPEGGIFDRIGSAFIAGYNTLAKHQIALGITTSVAAAGGIGYALGRINS